MASARRPRFGDFDLDEVLKALRRGRKIFKGSEFRAVLRYEEASKGYWCAISLEMNVVSTGSTIREALENLIALMAFHVDDFTRNGIEDQVFIPASDDVWKYFASSRRIPKRYIPEAPLELLNLNARGFGGAVFSAT